MIRILAIDHWAKGLFNYERLLTVAGTEPLAITLLHFGSIRDAKVRRVELASNILCVDIKAYRGLPLRDVIEQARPDVVLLLNIHTFLERAVLYICRSLGIPTVYLQHGAFVGYGTFRELCGMYDRNRSPGEYLRKIPQHLYLLWLYLRARPRWFDRGLLQLIWSQAARPRMASFFPALPEELQPDLALVFTPADVEAVTKTHGIPRDRFRVVGNPELDAAFHRAGEPLTALARRNLRRSVGLDAERPIVFFPDEGFAESHLYGWTEQTRDLRIAELARASREAGAQLLVRPRRAPEGGQEARQAGFVSTRGLSVVDSVDICDCVVGTVSSVLENAVVLKKPILVPLWHIEQRSQDSPYNCCPLATLVPSVEDLRMQIEKAARSEWPCDLQEFMEGRLGRIGGGACESIVEEIAGLARGNPRRNG